MNPSSITLNKAGIPAMPLQLQRWPPSLIVLTTKLYSQFSRQFRRLLENQGAHTAPYLVNIINCSWNIMTDSEIPMRIQNLMMMMMMKNEMIFFSAQCNRQQLRIGICAIEFQIIFIPVFSSNKIFSVLAVQFSLPIIFQRREMKRIDFANRSRAVFILAFI
ncbi:Hypothetical_protein [Hexamita inflata]|uniref:Hypothetical_protein n=1 Tax=Hexamita inflata TaxID=28002 RepID=A0AA86RL46_9EUKA|nr:Hypothetical protein HINF_LOCUS64241 [Hexamita inflata]